MGTRTDRWHNTGGNGRATATWVRKRKDRTVVVTVYPSHGLHNYQTCSLEEWDDKTRVATSTGLSFKFAKQKGEAFLGVVPRKSRAIGKKFSVVGFYRDNQQPFVSWERCATPKEASERAQERRGDHAVTIVEVFHGHNRGILENDEVIHGN